MQENSLGKIIIYKNCLEIFLYYKDSNNQSKFLPSILSTDLFFNKYSFRRHVIEFKDILNLKQLTVKKLNNFSFLSEFNNK